MNIEIANKLLQLRKEKGLSQEQLAQELGISRQAVSKWERAEASPDTDNLIELAKLYGISLDELLLNGTEKEDQIKDNQDNDQDDDNDQDGEEYHQSGDHVHISPKGIFVEDKNGDTVHVSWNGIHVKENEGHKVDIDQDGIYVDDKVYDKDWEHHSFEQNKKYDFPFGAFLFFGLLIYCCMTGVWHPTWVLLLSFPLFDSLITAIRKRKFSSFAYPLLAVMIFLWIGFSESLWHPGWVIFLTIPCYYMIAGYIDHKRTS